MQAYQRQYPLFSLCGLNCGLCPRYHTEGESRCPGCGGEDFFSKHPSCGVISCAQRHAGLEYCYLCAEYPCKRYENADESDSFISHLHQLIDLDKANNIGLAAYQAELDEKVEILRELLSAYNDGRRKNFFCLAVNLLTLSDIREVMRQIAAQTQAEDSVKEKSALAAHLFTAMAQQRDIALKLRKK